MFFRVKLMFFSEIHVLVKFMFVSEIHVYGCYCLYVIACIFLGHRTLLLGLFLMFCPL